MWNGFRYKSFMGIRAGEAADISALLATALDSDSEGPDLPPGAQNIKNRVDDEIKEIRRRKDKPGHPPAITCALPTRVRTPSNPLNHPPCRGRSQYRLESRGCVRARSLGVRDSRRWRSTPSGITTSDLIPRNSPHSPGVGNFEGTHLYRRAPYAQ